MGAARSVRHGNADGGSRGSPPGARAPRTARPSHAKGRGRARLRATLLGLVVLQGRVGGDASSSRTIDLNQSDALSGLQYTHPTHYRKIAEILDGLSDRLVYDVLRWVETAVGGRDVYYSFLLLTSDPPKRSLAFALDHTRYVAVVSLTRPRATLLLTH